MNRRKRKCYLGVDPGKHGGLGLLDQDGVALAWTRMPDGPALITEWLTDMTGRHRGTVIVTEMAQAMPKQGITGAFTYGRHFGLFEVTALYLKIPYHEVRPTVWKKNLGLTSKKLDSITLCRRLFPKVELIPAGCRKEHDGIAEALLIAEWARRQQL